MYIFQFFLGLLLCLLTTYYFISTPDAPYLLCVAFGFLSGFIMGNAIINHYRKNK